MTPAYQLNTQTFASQVFAEEVIVLDVNQGTYFALSGNAPQAWPGLVSGEAIPNVAAGIAVHTGQEPGKVEADLSAFVVAMVEEKVLIPLGAGQPAQALASEEEYLSDYLGFVWDKHSDLDELLVLDPIHDVSPEKGWPHAQ